MSEWVYRKLKDITNKIGSGATPKGGSGAYKVYGIPLIRSQNVLDFAFNYHGLAFIDDDQAFSLRNVIIEENDILLNITGDSVARCCSVPKNIIPARVNQHVAILRVQKEILDASFLKFTLINMKEELLVLSEIGGTRNALTKGMIENIEILIPNLSEQKAIASVLSSLDDKIDLLHRQNKTLESMAETLFRQWFVEEAQEDWEQVTLGNLADHIRCNIPKKNMPPNLKYVGLEHIDRRDIALKKHGYSEDVDSNKSAFLAGDILFGKLRPYFHKVCITPFDGICSTDILVLRPKLGKQKYFTLFSFFQSDVIDFASASSGGTRMPRIDWQSLSSFSIALPPEEKISKFENIVSPQLDKISANIAKIKSLESLRDTLLPKLMSGEVRVKYEESQA